MSVIAPGNNFTHTDNDRWDLAYDFVQETHKHIFLTGRAGTGKTTFLHRLKEKSFKRLVVTAPTGVAAINAGGVTLHSFFQLPFGPFIPEKQSLQGYAQGTKIKDPVNVTQHFNRDKIDIIRSLDLLVIDEISMVRADLLDSVDAVLRRYRDRRLPFGGVQLLMIGDLQQLPPVAKEDEWKILKPYYDTVYFFSSLALRQTQFITIELEHVYRQKDEGFIELLNRIRDNRADADTLKALNERVIPGFEPGEGDGYIILTTHNAKADSINQSRLSKLNGSPSSYQSRVEGNFPDYTFPADADLKLKVGAQVMFLKNDPSRDKRYFNGKIGWVEELDEDTVFVRCEDSEEVIPVSAFEWLNTKYTINRESGDISESIEGKFIQIPLRLAWAVTIHKSQGLTFDKAVIDARAAFAHGQVYVALSRCRTLEGIVLSTPLSNQAIITDRVVAEFSLFSRDNLPGPALLRESKKAYQLLLLKELFDFSGLLRQAESCVRLFSQNSSSLALDYSGIINPLPEKLKAGVSDYSRKFSVQLTERFRDIDFLHADDPIQDRIKKAAAYFAEKLKTDIRAGISGLEIDADNQAARKLLKDAVKKVHLESLVKFRCMEACMEGFSVDRLLKAKAKALIEKPEAAKRKISPMVPVSVSTGDQKLYDHLRAWRMTLSEESGVPVYMIMPNSTLAEIAFRKPASMAVLRGVRGVGRKKLGQFGEELLEIIRMHTGNGNEPENEKDDEDGMRSSKSRLFIKKPAYWESAELARSGLSIPEIAAKRGYTERTIESHLAEAIRLGEVDVFLFISREKFDRIKESFDKTQSRFKKPVKEDLGDEVSYGELGFVLAHMDYSDQSGKGSEENKP